MGRLQRRRAKKSRRIKKAGPRRLRRGVFCMETIAFFDTKPYDRVWFEKLNPGYEIRWFDSRLNRETAVLAQGCAAVCAFVHDELDAETISALCAEGCRVAVMRCAGVNNVDLAAAQGRLPVARVPGYSPHAVAEHTMALLLTLNRKLHRAWARTRDFNFSIAGLEGIDLYGKTAGIVGGGRIGRAFAGICRGFGMRVVCYDPYPTAMEGCRSVTFSALLEESDVISLHCPLTRESYHMLDTMAFLQMKRGVFLLNTSRGALIDTEALLRALNSGRVRGAGLDVYEEESDLFFEDRSGSIIRDDALSLLLSKPNVILTSHQAFLTEEALREIARVTYANLDAFFAGEEMENEVKGAPRHSHE